MEMQRYRFAVIVLTVALTGGCASAPSDKDDAAKARCVGYAREQLAMRGTPVDIYVFEAARKGANVQVEVSPPPVKDPQKDAMYFGGGGTFVCDGKGRPLSETFDK